MDVHFLLYQLGQRCKELAFSKEYETGCCLFIEFLLVKSPGQGFPSSLLSRPWRNQIGLVSGPFTRPLNSLGIPSPWKLLQYPPTPPPPQCSPIGMVILILMKEGRKLQCFKKKCRKPCEPFFSRCWVNEGETLVRSRI